MSYDIIIVGGGPAGLSCARTAAERGMHPLVIERKKSIGKKVCAGGITWNGLMRNIPGFIAEKEFSSQFLHSKLQRAEITAQTPIIATINREKLGRYMAEKARNAGAEIRTSCHVKSIGEKDIILFDRRKGRTEKIKYRYLVGADGSSSLVRRYLGISIDFAGVGINYQLPGDISRMEWHFNSSLFKNGYAWVFPHSGTVSVGAYTGSKGITPLMLKKNLIQWADRNGFCIKNSVPSAAYINYDYRGWRFRENIFLAGDAAGLASGLTGEGIYPAIISGNAVALHIETPEIKSAEFSRLITLHKKHKKMAAVTGKSQLIATVIAELVIFGLRAGLIPFTKIEMAS